MEETGEDARWRQEHLSATEQRWAEDQRQLRTHLVTSDMLDFAWRDRRRSHGPEGVQEESKGDSEASSSSSLSTKPPLSLVGGIDISFVENSNDACAALVVCEYPSMRIVYQSYEMVTLTAPYIAGFLAFREVEHLLRLLDRLRSEQPQHFPQIILVDGNGVLHHRGFGLASHFGVLANIPTIGIGKNLLLVDGLDRSVVQAQSTATLHKGGEYFDLVGQSGTVWGACVRATDAASSPIFVSIGHRISLPTAVQVVTACCHHRIPEPVRLADLNSREFIRKWKVAHPPPIGSVATAAAAAASSVVSPAIVPTSDADENASEISAASLFAAAAPPSHSPTLRSCPSHEHKSDNESTSAPDAMSPIAAEITSRPEFPSNAVPSAVPPPVRPQRQVSEPPMSPDRGGVAPPPQMERSRSEGRNVPERERVPTGVPGGCVIS